MNEMKEKLEWRRLVITVGIVLATAAAVGGTVWYLMDQNAKSIADSNARSVSALEEQMEGQSPVTDTKTETVEVVTPTSTTVVAFEPAGLFTDAEKADIKSKVTDAYIAYTNEKEFSVVSVLIHKYAASERPAGYMYSVDAIHTNSGTTGWLFGEEGKAIEYWKPECMDGECPLTDLYKQKYPNNF